MVSIVGTIFIGFISYIISKKESENGSKRNTLLEFQLENGTEQTSSDYQNIIAKYTKKMKLLNIKTLDNRNLLVSYYIRFRKENQKFDLVNQLQNIPGLKNISLFSDEEEF